MLIARVGLLIALAAQVGSAVEPGLPSKTAVYVAVARAIGAKNPDPEFRNPDHFAIKFLGPRERAILPDYPMDALDLDFDEAIKRIPNPANVTALVARTRAYDAALDDALRSGVRQVVVLGAGFDSRGHRFESRLRGVRFFEVDQGPTQDYKKRRVQEILGKLPGHVRYVSMDFTKDSLLEQLTKAGYSPREKTFFLWEGVVHYIPESAVASTLHFVRDHSAPGSTIAFDYPLSRHTLVNNPASMYARWGEPWIFGFPGKGAADFVQRAGLEVVSDMLMSDPRNLAYIQRRDGTSSLPPPPSAASASTSGRCIARVPDKR